MDGAEQILVIILSAFLALFLVLAIIATYKFIQVLNSLKRISEHAEHIAGKAETISDIFASTSGPLAVGKLLSHLAETVFKHNKKEKK
ncbi:MAG: hypothetical protein U5L95_03480 [Candidatus Saccharibacteria bacterium]|nr:hypothetical protein [Candidatus Saccharibacteria bacterium]